MTGVQTCALPISRSYSYIGSVPVLDVFDRPIADWDVVMKWLFDKLVGGLALIAALPVMAIVALAIKLDSRGPDRKSVV